MVCILDRDAEARRKILRDLPDLTAALDADVSDLKQVQSAFAEAIRLMGGVDVLVNNAGISIRHNFLEITPEEWDQVIAVNLTGVFYVGAVGGEAHDGARQRRDSANGLDQRRDGVSILRRLQCHQSGRDELTKSMALELAPKVRVCAVAPGYVLTPMQHAEYTDAMLAEVNRKIPLRRHAQPEEIAALFAFLASDDAQNITGHVYTCDGGETAGGLASR